MNSYENNVLMNPRYYLKPYIGYLVIEIIHSHVVNNNNLWNGIEFWNIWH